MKGLSLFIILIISFMQLPAQTLKPQIGPINPDFIKYMEELHNAKLEKCDCSNYPAGIIPHPLKLGKAIPGSLKKMMQLPARYDLRDQEKVTPAKNQGICGSCWSFTVLGSIESRWLDLGLGTFDLSEQNLKNRHGFVTGHCSGGNAAMANAYLIRGDGPVAETDDPYAVNDSISEGTYTLQGHITDARFLPNDPDLIKQTIMEYGAVYSSLIWDDAFYNNFDYTYYSTSESGEGHGALICGWDDTIVTTGGTGAWIVKNSWGTGWGDNGFYYISYNDVNVNDEVAFWPGRITYDASLTIYGYDELGALGAAGYSDDDTDYAMVKFVVSQDQYLTRVGTFVHVPNSTISFTVYNDFNGNVPSNELSSIGDQLCTYDGYYSYNLPESIYLTSGEDIYIKVKYNTPGELFSIPVEILAEELVDYAAPTIESNCCWISFSGANNTWLPIGENEEILYDLCIKAYGAGSPVNIIESNVIPDGLKLYQNYPNPFNPKTVIDYSIYTNGHVELEVFNIIGKSVVRLVDEVKTAGNYSSELNGENLASGVYFYRLKSDGFTLTKKMILMR